MPYPSDEAREELRSALEQLSKRTRTAMLDAVRCPSTVLIAGAYAVPGGGACPLLAAHRRGGRTHDASSAASTFASAWDSYTGAGTGPARPIDEGERRTLEGILSASLARERRRRAEAELARAAAERKAAEHKRRGRELRELVAGARRGLGARVADALHDASPDRSRSSELSSRSGWAWLGVYRRYDDYRAALARALSAERAAPAADERSEERDTELVA